jgi:hypothetical protein
MIVEGKLDNNIYDQGWEFQGELIMLEPSPLAAFEDFHAMQHKIRDGASHNQYVGAC